ncbi:hypothetical protein F4809DRAFT_359746 [Biscogniauxia mediterranea]|nr:hypothetical protein F4809DRAFT_359746 [Biscogniauxia mediterranea]
MHRISFLLFFFFFFPPVPSLGGEQPHCLKTLLGYVCISSSLADLQGASSSAPKKNQTCIFQSPHSFPPPPPWYHTSHAPKAMCCGKGGGG